jgi:uncharacterized protein YebE (UPF0316 family)
MKVFASALGFFEVSIWLFAIGQIMQNLTNIGCYVAFAGGFTLGNYLGIAIETKLAIGTVVLRTITNRKADVLIERLQQAGYGVTCVDCQSATESLKLVLTVIKRKELPNVVTLVRTVDSAAFYWVDEIKETTARIPSAMSERTKRAVHRVVHSRREISGTVAA